MAFLDKTILLFPQSDIRDNFETNGMSGEIDAGCMLWES